MRSALMEIRSSQDPPEECSLTDQEDAEQGTKMVYTGERKCPWYQHEEVGYNYRMSNVIAGVVRGQFPHLEEHIAQKKAIYERYKEGLKELPVSMNPYNEEKSVPNFWLSCLIVDKNAMCRQVRGEQDALYVAEAGKSCPTEILDAISSVNAEGRPIWKPMHMQPIYRNEWFCYQRRKRQSRDKCLYCRWTGRCWNGYFQQGIVSA